MRNARFVALTLSLVAVCGLSVPAMASADYDSAVLADSPLAFYHLNEASGLVAADSSGNGPATDGLYAIGGVSYGVARPFPSTGSASAVYQTSGTVDSVVLAGAHTASFWVKPSQRLAQSFLQHGDPAGDGWAIGIAPNNAPRGGKRKLLFQSHGVSVNSKISLASGVWSMVSVSWDAASVSFRLNGEATPSDQHARRLAHPGPPPTRAYTRAGAGAGGTCSPNRPFPAVLTKAQLTAHYGRPCCRRPLPARAFAAVRGAPDDTLTPTPATYSTATTSSLEWQRCDAAGGCTPIAGETDTAYPWRRPTSTTRSRSKRPQPTPTVRSAASPTPPTRSSLSCRQSPRESPRQSPRQPPPQSPPRPLPRRASARLGSLPPGAAAHASERSGAHSN